MLIKELYDAGELELTICGKVILDLVSLKECTLYQKGFTRECKQMVWFWDIVLNEFDNEGR